MLSVSKIFADNSIPTMGGSEESVDEMPASQFHYSDAPSTFQGPRLSQVASLQHP